MQKFDNFIFKYFEFDKTTLKAKFCYSFDDKEFFLEELDFFNDSFKLRKDFLDKIFESFLFSIFISLWISYYKLYPTKNLIIENYNLNIEDLNFWKKFYINWLWEFFYKNKIDPSNLCNFVSKWQKILKKYTFDSRNNILLPIWWWKDSIVSAEILQRNKFEFTPFIFGKKDEIKEKCLNIIDKNEIFIKRKISENLFKLNELWYYNWHVPITGIISFVLLATAYLYDYKYIILSNEKSANTWNLKLEINKFESKKEHKTLEINHQYSKSLEFEKDINDYIKRNLSDNILYFSLLRWMYEIKIAKIFAKIWKKYFLSFSSCNKNFKIRKEFLTTSYKNDKINLENDCSGNLWLTKNCFWCLDCPKCAFVYAILRAFLSDKEILQIFSKEMYEDKNQENLFKELLWIKWIKPFECVWEKEEVIYAMQKTLEKFKSENKKISIILKMFEKEIILSKNELNNLEKKLFWNYEDETFIPTIFKDLLKKKL